MAINYVSTDTATLFEAATGNAKLLELLWGDHLSVLETAGTRTKVKARGKTGFVNTGEIGDQSLLEVYFIDVGQGDGVLIRTPDDRHIMLDGGYDRSKQPTGKNAADFVSGLDHRAIEGISGGRVGVCDSQGEPIGDQLQGTDANLHGENLTVRTQYLARARRLHTCRSTQAPISLPRSMAPPGRSQSDRFAPSGLRRTRTFERDGSGSRTLISAYPR